MSCLCVADEIPRRYTESEILRSAGLSDANSVMIAVALERLVWCAHAVSRVMGASSRDMRKERWARRWEKVGECLCVPARVRDINH